MIATKKILAALALVLAAAAPASAQESTTAPATNTAASTTSATATTSTTTAAAKPAAQTDPDSQNSPQEIRQLFERIVDEHPRNVARIIAADPTMVTNEPFVNRYPDLADFINRHPEIRRNPYYYADVLSVGTPPRPRSGFEEAAEGLSIAGVLSLVAFFLAWVIRTIIEQKRWKQLARTQVEVHNKILDRFGSSAEVLDYIKTPAGARFLESAPIPLDAARPFVNAPQSRILRSMQTGVVLAAAGAGMLLVSLRMQSDTSSGFFAFGMIAFSLGAGFILSAVVTVIVSRRLGIWNEAATQSAVPDDIGVVR